jgi:hypothetical protein
MIDSRSWILQKATKETGVKEVHNGRLSMITRRVKTCE